MGVCVVLMKGGYLFDVFVSFDWFVEVMCIVWFDGVCVLVSNMYGIGCMLLLVIVVLLL